MSRPRGSTRKSIDRARSGRAHAPQVSCRLRPRSDPDAAGLVASDLFVESSSTKSSIVATYHYHDEGGLHLYDVVRKTRRISDNVVRMACGP